MTRSAAVADPRVQVALYRSAVYEALALAFAYPTATQRARLSILLEDMLDVDTAVDEELRGHVRALLATLDAADETELGAEHNRLFDQTAPCSPFETEYEADPFAKSRQLSDVAGFYNAFGMEVSRERPTMHDFIGTELEFLSLLSRKEAYAAARNWMRRRELTLDAQRSFLRDHLGRWERTLCADLTRALETDDHAAARFYLVVAGLCERFVEDELRTFHVKPLRLKRRMIGDREPMVCPLAPPVSAVETGSLSLGDAEEFATEEFGE